MGSMPMGVMLSRMSTGSLYGDFEVRSVPGGTWLAKASDSERTVFTIFGDTPEQAVAGLYKSVFPPEPRTWRNVEAFVNKGELHIPLSKYQEGRFRLNEKVVVNITEVLEPDND